MSLFTDLAKRVDSPRFARELLEGKSLTNPWWLTTTQMMDVISWLENPERERVIPAHQSEVSK